MNINTADKILALSNQIYALTAIAALDEFHAWDIEIKLIYFAMLHDASEEMRNTLRYSIYDCGFNKCETR
jgi:hypothetical protein